MENKKVISINDAPKALRLFLILLPVVGIFLIGTEINNDFFFLYKTGEHILNEGFPTKDFLSMHSGMDIVVQQWASDVVFYTMYSRLGLFGLFGFIYLCYAVFAVIMFKLCKLICDNEFSAAICAFVADIFSAGIFFTTRPNAISEIIFVAELFILEKYVKTKSTKPLILLPVLSLLLVNFHASMWLLFFVFALPFAAEAIPIKIGKFRQEPCCNFFVLLITGVVCFAAGFLNPYATKAMFYVFTSFGYSEINSLIVEMAPTRLNNPLGILFYIILAVMAITVLLTRKKNFKTRFVLLFFGTLVLAVMNLRSTGLFGVAAIPAFSYYIKDIDIKITLPEKGKKSQSKGKIAILSLLIVAVAAAGTVLIIGNENDKVQPEKSPYETLNEASEIMKEEKDEVVLFTGFDYGQYMEFKGFHPYIDGRAELFLKDNNHEADYLKEYYNLLAGKLDCGKFINKYGFNYLVVEKQEKHLYKYLENNEKFERVLSDKKLSLFRRKTT